MLFDHIFSFNRKLTLQTIFFIRIKRTRKRNTGFCIAICICSKINTLTLEKEWPARCWEIKTNTLINLGIATKAYFKVWILWFKNTKNFFLKKVGLLERFPLFLFNFIFKNSSLSESIWNVKLITWFIV